MSEITDRIKLFAEGRLSREDLVRELADRHYATPALERNYPSDPYEQWVHSEAADRSEEGTFDEVTSAWARRLLPNDVYMEILRVREHRSNRPKPPTAFR